MKPRGACGSSRPGAGLALALLLGLGLPGCGKEAAREAPPQTGKPSEPAPPPPAEPAPAAEQGASPEMLEKDRAADEAPRAPPAPASKAPAPSGRSLPAERAAPSKAARGAAPADDYDFGAGKAPLTPQVLRQRLDEVVKQSTPDCPSARDRKQAICDLASQICQMVEHDPDVASVESYCDDAKHRCSEAERRTAQRCK